MDKCQRCGAGGFSLRLVAVTLAGNTHAQLCAECRNRWNEFVSGHEVWQERLAEDAREAYLDGLAAAGTPPAESDWLDLRLRRHETDRKLHALGIEFIKPLPVPA